MAERPELFQAISPGAGRPLWSHFGHFGIGTRAHRSWEKRRGFYDQSGEILKSVFLWIRWSVFLHQAPRFSQLPQKGIQWKLYY